MTSLDSYCCYCCYWSLIDIKHWAMKERILERDHVRNNVLWCLIVLVSRPHLSTYSLGTGPCLVLVDDLTELLINFNFNFFYWPLLPSQHPTTPQQNYLSSSHSLLRMSNMLERTIRVNYNDKILHVNIILYSNIFYIYDNLKSLPENWKLSYWWLLWIHCLYWEYWNWALGRRERKPSCHSVLKWWRSSAQLSMSIILLKLAATSLVKGV